MSPSRINQQRLRLCGAILNDAPRCTGYQRPLPAPYPAKQSIVANLVATVGMRQGWGTNFVRAAYRRWFQLGQGTGSEPNVSDSLRDIGQEPRLGERG